ncbi:MAG: hypothetical protein BMS9Abin01_0580 [Gammaproteobacteria bacterium]|nr:MAG: hypothetical protein BMS9Abin01_0580 [Gammaproteobacteria bacterium]
MAERKKSCAVGFNHVALEVGDIDEALAFYGEFLEFELRSMGLGHLDKSDSALNELADKGMAPD